MKENKSKAKECWSLINYFQINSNYKKTIDSDEEKDYDEHHEIGFRLDHSSLD